MDNLLKEVNITQPFQVVLTWFVQSPDNFSVTMKLIQPPTTPPKPIVTKDLHKLPLPFTLPDTLQPHKRTDTYKYIVVGSRSYSNNDNESDNDNEPSFKIIHDGKVVNYKTDDTQEDDDDENNILELVKLGVLQKVNEADDTPDKIVDKSGNNYMLVPHDTSEG